MERSRYKEDIAVHNGEVSRLLQDLQASKRRRRELPDKEDTQQAWAWNAPRHERESQKTYTLGERSATER